MLFYNTLGYITLCNMTYWIIRVLSSHECSSVVEANLYVLHLNTLQCSLLGSF